MILANDPIDRSTPPWSWTAVADLIRLRNQSGTWLLMLPSLWSLVLATHGRPPIALMGVFVLGAFVMRSLGVVFNDLADRHFDKHVARTSSRPLADGRLAPRQALLVALILAICAALLVLTLNPLTMLLSPIALFLAAIYPFSKRWIHIPQAVLGSHSDGERSWPGPLRAAGSTRRPGCSLAPRSAGLWPMIRSMHFRTGEDDRRIGVKSSALFFGDAVPAAVGLFLGGMVVCLVLAGQVSGLRMDILPVLALLAGLFWWQVQRLKASVTPHTAFTLFQQHVYAGAADFARHLARHVRQFALADYRSVHLVDTLKRLLEEIRRPVLSMRPRWASARQSIDELYGHVHRRAYWCIRQTCSADHSPIFPSGLSGFGARSVFR